MISHLTYQSLKIREQLSKCDPSYLREANPQMYMPAETAIDIQSGTLGFKVLL